MIKAKNEFKQVSIFYLVFSNAFNLRSNFFFRFLCVNNILLIIFLSFVKHDQLKTEKVGTLYHLIWSQVKGFTLKIRNLVDQQSHFYHLLFGMRVCTN